MGDDINMKVEELKVTENDDFVDPWNVTANSDSGIDYDKLKKIRRQQNLYFFGF